MSFYNLILSLGREHKKVAIKINEICKFKSNEKIIDIGAGSGLLAEYLPLEKNNITLLEPSKKMLEKTNKGYPKLNIKIQEINKINEKYDFVVCFDSLHHFSNGYENKKEQIILGINNMVSIADKKIVIVEPNPKKLKTKWIIFIENFIFRIGSYFPKEEEYEELMEGKIFKLEKWKHYNIIIVEK